MKIVYGKRKRYILITRLMLLFITLFAIFRLIQQRVKITKLKRENEKISVILNTE